MRRKSAIQALIWSAIGVIVMVAVLVAYGFVQRMDIPSSPDFPSSTLTIQRASGASVKFNIEVATTPEQKSYGLMFRRSLPIDAGMIFVWTTDYPFSFWMKNTYISLDMLFIRHDGTIVKIVTHAKPLKLDPINADEPVRGVLEINAGAVERFGIVTGDKVIFPGFSDAL